MARPKDAEIEKCLRRITKAACDAEETVTVRTIRNRVAKEIGLDDRFLDEDATWKKKSRDVVNEVMDKAAAAKYEASMSISHKPKATETAYSSTSWENQKKSKVPTEQPNHAQISGLSKGAQTSRTTSSENTTGSIGSSDSGHNSASESSSTNDTDSDSDSSKLPSDTASPTRAVKRKKEINTLDSSSERIAENSRGEPPSKKNKLDVNKSKVAPTVPTPAAVRPAVPANKFIPPHGYAPYDTSRISHNTHLSDINLNGKRIWHIVAPASVPISSLHTLARNALESDTTILTSKGVDYVLREDKSRDTNSFPNIFIPTNEGYVCIKHKVEHAYRVQQKIVLPDLSIRQASQMTESTAADNFDNSAVSKIRPQPKGMKMRYRPPGFGAGRLGRIGSDSESSDDATEEDTRVRRKELASDLVQETAPVVKKGVTRQGVEAHKRNAKAETIEHLTPDESRTPDKEKSRNPEKDFYQHAPNLSSVNGTAPESPKQLMTNGVMPEVDSNEERRKRKEEKRARKEEKRKAKAKAQ